MFNRYKLSKEYIQYKTYLSSFIVYIKELAFQVECNNRCFIRISAKRVIEESFKFCGYIECLFDLGIISENDYDRFWDFISLIRYDANEILLYLDNTI